MFFYFDNRCRFYDFYSTTDFKCPSTSLYYGSQIMLPQRFLLRNLEHFWVSCFKYFFVLNFQDYQQILFIKIINKFNENILLFYIFNHFVAKSFCAVQFFFDFLQQQIDCFKWEYLSMSTFFKIKCFWFQFISLASFFSIINQNRILKMSVKQTAIVYCIFKLLFFAMVNIL